MSASWVELSWTGIAVVGTAMTVWMLHDVLGDYLAVREGVRRGYAIARGARWWSAVGAMGGYALDGVVWMGFLLVGLMAIFETWIQWAGWILILMEVVLAGSQIWRRIARTKMLGRPHFPRVVKSASEGTST